MSKVLRRLAENDPRFESYSDETFGLRDVNQHDGHWLYTSPGWKWNGDPLSDLHQIHEWTVKEVLAEVRNIVPCDCKECAEILLGDA